MFNKKILAASMAAAISTGMVAQSHAMMMQENNLGQVLLSPIYVTTDSGLNTDIVVVNTRTDAAVKAKIVFRDGVKSAEVLDFILYLSPGDVWRGSVTGAVNAAKIESTDDSMTDNSGNFASETNPVSQPFFFGDQDGIPRDSGPNGLGHFEVFGVYSVTVGSTTVPAPSTSGASTVNVTQGMPKVDLKAVFDQITASGDKGSISGSAVASSVDPGHLQLMGEVHLTDGGSNTYSSFVMPAVGPDSYALGNIDNPHTGYQNYVIANPEFDATVAQDTPIGFEWGPFGEDRILDVEAAMATVDMAFEYNVDNGNVTLPIVSFVTKYRHEGDTVGVCGGGAATNLPEPFTYSAPFNDTITGEIIFTFTSFDNLENSEVVVDGQFSGGGELPPSALPDEVNVLSPSYFSTSGWANMNYAGVRRGCYYQGAPALGVTLKSGGSGFMMSETADRRSSYYSMD